MADKTHEAARPPSIREEIKQSRPFRSRSQEAYLAIVHDGFYRIQHPPQQQSAASVTYNTLPATVVDCHSHGSMAAHFSGTDDQVLPYASQKESGDRARANGNYCEQVTYEGGDHYIPGPYGDDIKARAAEFIFEQALWPLGYRPEVVDAAA